MNKQYKILLLFLISSIFVGCTALKSSINSVGRNIGTLFSTPRKIENKITDVYLPDAKLAVTWIGHATVLIQIEDKFILTDPHLVSTGGMISKRVVEPGIEPENLPNIDLVLISHLHIDHLSHESLQIIEDKVSKLIAPEKGLVYIPNFEFDMDELKIGDSWEDDNLRVTATPIVHNGWRYGVDKAWMDVSYAGFLIEYKGIKVYFSGDTAYDKKLFTETGQKFNNIDLALLPVAPIHPREYSKSRHTDPIEAIQIFEDLNAEYMIPIHYDTFMESYDTLGEASAMLRKEMFRKNLSEDKIVILEIGERYQFISNKN